jgi:hypothetical protein
MPADIWNDAWNEHTHPEFGPESPRHIHSPDADWSISFNLSSMLRHNDDLDVIEMMEFRGLTMNMRAMMEEARRGTDLEEMSKSQRQFTVLSYNVDSVFTDTLINLVDQALRANGIDPPCQLQEVDSSQIRSFGFVMVEDDENVQPTTGTLYVAFHGGGLYKYPSVDVDVVNEMVEADSKGSFFSRHIKGVYDFTKVR